MHDPTDLISLNFCSGHGEVVTAHRESLRIPVQSSFNCFFDTRKIKNCKQTWKKPKRLKTLEGGYSRNTVLAWRFYLIFQFLWNDRFIMIRKTHRDKSTSLLGRESAIPFLKLIPFTAHIWSSQHHFTLISVDLIEAWKAGVAMDEEIIRMWQWFTRYFLFRKEVYDKWHTRF